MTSESRAWERPDGTEVDEFGVLPRELTVTVALRPMSDGTTLHLVEVIDHTIHPPEEPGGEPVDDITMADVAICDEWMAEHVRVGFDDPTPRCKACIWEATR